MRFLAQQPAPGTAGQVGEQELAAVAGPRAIDPAAVQRLVLDEPILEGFAVLAERGAFDALFAAQIDVGGSRAASHDEHGRATESLRPAAGADLGGTDGLVLEREGAVVAAPRLLRRAIQRWADADHLVGDGVAVLAEDGAADGAELVGIGALLHAR